MADEWPTNSGTGEPGHLGRKEASWTGDYSRFRPQFDKALPPIAGPSPRRPPRPTPPGSIVPSLPAAQSGAVRDYLRFVVTSYLRFDANIRGFEFTPSIGMVARDFDRLTEGLQNFHEPLTKAVTQVIIPSIRTNFHVGGRPDWEPLEPETLKRRRETGFAPGPILVRTGKLRKAATSLAIWNIGRVTATIRKLPESVWYGYLHQSGMQGPSSTAGAWLPRWRAIARKKLGPKAPNSKVEKLAWLLFDESLNQIRFGYVGGMRHTRREVNIPQRRFVVFQQEDVTRIQVIFYNWLDKEIAQKGKFRPGA